MTTRYDGKINIAINFQLSCDGSYLIHINRFSWTEGEIIESQVTVTHRKSYTVSKTSYTRIANLCREWANKKIGHFDIWQTCPGWEYKDFGNEVAQ